jgi:hypothetical protein
LGESYFNAARWLNADVLPLYKEALDWSDREPDLKSQRFHLFLTALDSYKKAAQKLFHSYERADALYRAALSNYYLGRLQDCASLASQAFAAEPIHVESAYLCGFANYQLGNFRHAHNWARAAALLGTKTQNLPHIDMTKLPQVRRHGFVDDSTDRAWDLYQWASFKDGAPDVQTATVKDLWEQIKKG